MTQVQEAPKTESQPQKPQVHPYPVWSPRFWHGMRFLDWMKLLAKNRFAVSPSRMPMSVAITAFSAFNSTASIAQSLFLGGKIKRTVVEKPPVFIIGHWRSGTTYLHELMVRDEQFSFPNTYECFAPGHFLLTTGILSAMVGKLLPKKRPMDNMSMGVAHPQEDEFALSNMGCPTPYLRIAFPNRPPCHMDLLDMHDVPEKVLKRWERDIEWFVRALTYRKKKQLVLKSPPHTGRIEVLAKLFPDARFIHITRDPYAIFASTRRLWKSLYQVQSLQSPRFDDLDEYIFECFERMYQGFERQRSAVGDRLFEVRYEEVVKDPVGQLETIYEELDLGDFELVRENVEAYVGDQKGYRPNKHQFEPGIQEEIRRRWTYYFDRYEY